ncbi:MAG: hypothetical protein DUD34_10265 [Lactobacillus sp.]|jgi:uncharacterized protein YdhG (YjbR/CyaY superfamily)|nr:MAG: hypothetical protein DUD34_10265 [Lactobacillus sp.]
MDKLIHEYIEAQPKSRQLQLIQLYKTIAEQMPAGYDERISYGMPTFHFHRNIIHFGNFKDHFGLYPGPVTIQYFSGELKNYKTSKGAIWLSVDKPLPAALIRQLVQYNLKKI